VQISTGGGTGGDRGLSPPFFKNTEFREQFLPQKPHFDRTIVRLLHASGTGGRADAALALTRKEHFSALKKA